MNTSTDSDGGDGGSVGSFPYVVGISVGILFLLTTLTIATYFCTRTTVPSPNRRLRPAEQRDFVVEFGPGLEDEVINGYPKILYSEVKLEGKLSPPPRGVVRYVWGIIKTTTFCGCCRIVAICFTAVVLIRGCGWTLAALFAELRRCRRRFQPLWRRRFRWPSEGVEKSHL